MSVSSVCFHSIVKHQEETYAWFAFFGSQVLIEKQAGGWHIPCGTEPPVAVPEGNTVHEIGTLDGHPARAFALSEPVAGGEDGPRMMKDLRASFDVLPFEEYRMAGTASQILTWDLNSRFCPRCGVRTVQTARIAKRCPQCGQEIYPRISPAIIVLIKRGEDEVLLVHARNFRGTFRGLVAGFLEPGETLEECVRREVMEETGLAIKPLFCQPAVALSQRHHGGLRGGVCGRRYPFAGRGVECRRILP